MAQSGLVASDEENDDNPTNDNTSIKRQLDVTKQTHRATSIIPKDGFDYLSVVRRLYKNWNLSSTTIDQIINIWREGTKSQYKLYFNKWCFYCEERKMNPLQPTSIEAIEFLTYLFKQGHSHGQINAARSALSSIISLTNSSDVSFGNLPSVKCLMKGIYEAKPNLPKYRIIWNVGTVFNYFRRIEHQDQMSVSLLGKKLALLMGLLSEGQRSQTLHTLNIEDMKILGDKCIIPIMQKIKQTRPGKHMKPLIFKRFLQEPKLCVVSNLKSYINRTKHLRKDCELFISCIAPFCCVTKDTVCRWCKDILRLARIDINLYTTHSSRAAASFAKTNGISINEIMDLAGWSSEKSFSIHYNKIVKQEFNIGQEILKKIM